MQILQKYRFSIKVAQKQSSTILKTLFGHFGMIFVQIATQITANYR